MVSKNFFLAKNFFESKKNYFLNFFLFFSIKKGLDYEEKEEKKIAGKNDIV